ncbi:hypothetical protein [Halalkalicoccus salilacus]|uniref:hypothetical protein n=1 Tax=Halalkalicoccus TaxID=332246 RepID=UPI002F96E472
MENQRFLESEWDYCIVLDACRYDVFADLYDEYLDGDLEKRWSTGSSTPEWAYRTFTGDHDIAYFSGNPFINSLGIPLNELKWGASCDYPWTATDRIREVIDVWDHGWDDELGTVPPESLASSLREHRDAVERAERTVLHYMQPHAPYLTRGKGQKLTQIRKGINRQGEAEEADDDTVLSSVSDAIRPRIESTLEGSEFAQKAGLWLELDPTGLWRDGTRETAMAYYEENLRIAFEAVAELIEELDGRVVVTADHGEAFGEEGVWEHHIETHIPALMEVPWLEVERGT